MLYFSFTNNVGSLISILLAISEISLLLPHFLKNCGATEKPKDFDIDNDKITLSVKTAYFWIGVCIWFGMNIAAFAFSRQQFSDFKDYSKEKSSEMNVKYDKLTESVNNNAKELTAISTDIKNIKEDLKNLENRYLYSLGEFQGKKSL